MNTPEEAKAVLGRLFKDVLTDNNLDMIDEIYAEDYEFDAPALTANSGPAQSGREAFKARVRAFRGAFPNISYSIDNIVSDGEIICTKFHMSGHHAGPFAGFAATDRDVTITGVHFTKLNDQGKIKKTWAGFTNIAEVLAPSA
jgi:steroid delta-isomerase-like uncharacterized protein